MIKFLQNSVAKLFLVLVLAASASAYAQLPTSPWPISSPYSENFNVRPGTAYTTYPNGWKAYRGTTLDTEMTIGNGTSTSGANYNYNSSIGLLASGSYAAPLYIVVEFASTAGKTGFKISYDVKKIREQGRSNSFNLEISTTGPTSGFTAIAGGEYASGTLAEGNVKSYTNLDISGIDNKEGQVWLRWAYTEISGSGSRDGMALDNVVISWNSGPLNAPVATAATENITGSSFIANWNAVTGATGYRLDVATDNLFANKLEDYDDIAVSGTSHLVNLGIQPNTTYHYRVRAEKNEETSVNSNIIDVTTGTFVLQAPVTIAANGLLTDGFMANWNAVAGATGYYLDVSTSPDFGNVLETFTTETFTNMPEPSVVHFDQNWVGDGGIGWFGGLLSTIRRVPGSTTDRIACLHKAEPQIQSYILSDAITGDFNSLSFDAYKILNNGSFSTVTASVLSGPNFETETILGTQDTPSNTTTKNTFSIIMPNLITGPYKIKILVTDSPEVSSGIARTGLDNVRFGSRVVTGPSFVTGYNNLDVGNVTTYQVTGLQPGTKYYYRVRAYTATETSGNSNVTDVVTSCIVVTPPTASPQMFCNAATVANLQLAETGVHWYTVQTGGAELAATAALSSGTYYASLFTGNCESTRVAVTVTITNTPMPVVTPMAVCNAGTVADLVANGTDLKWYADATAITQLDPATALVAGNYYVTQTLNTCESARAVLAVTINTAPDAPVAVNQILCGPSTVAQLMPAPVSGIAPITESFEVGNLTGLTGTHNFATGAWVMQNGTNQGTGANAYSGNSIRFISLQIYTSPAFNKIKSISFYAKAEGTKSIEVKKVVGGNEISLQTIMLTTSMQYYTIPVNEENDNVKIKFIGQQSIIIGYLDELVFRFDDGTPQVKWYGNETGGTALASTEALTSGNYYVSQIVNGCESPRTEVEVTINTIPDAPTATALALCGTPTVAQLTATGDNLKWYASETGGAELIVTEVVTAGSYYVSQTINGCESPRAEVAVTINATPDTPVATALDFCGSATVAELTATGTSLKWYAAETGGNALADTDVVTSTTYYVSQTVDTCESSRTSVVVTVSQLPEAPVVASLSFCGNTVASQLPVTGGTDLKWYAAETGGTSLLGTEAVTTGNYYVSQTVDGCESLRIAVAVTVNPIPAAPAIAQPAQTFCGGATVADLLPDDATIKWYTTASNGTALTADAVLTSGLSIYYASQTIDGCESISRTSVAVMVNTTALPVANGNYTFCNVATVADLDANGTALKWYATETATEELEGTVSLATGTYYVTQTLNSCESAKVPVPVTVNEAVAPVAAPLTLCGASTVEDLTAQGTNLKWYVSTTAMDVLSITAPVTTGTYYVSQTIGTCESPRTAVAVTVNTTPAISAGPFTFCNNATAGELTAVGASVKWYATETATDELEETVALATGTYYVTQTINECESTRTVVTVTVTNPVATGAAVQQYNTGETLADLEVTGPGIVWYADEALTEELPVTTVLTEWYTYYAVPNEGDCTGEALAVQVDDLLGNGGFDIKSLQYYPNPVKDVLTVNYSQAITAVEVYNIVGQLVINKAPDAATVQIDMAALQDGTYIVKLQSGNTTQVLKLIKQ